MYLSSDFDCSMLETTAAPANNLQINISESFFLTDSVLEERFSLLDRQPHGSPKRTGSLNNGGRILTYY